MTIIITDTWYRDTRRRRKSLIEAKLALRHAQVATSLKHLEETVGGLHLGFTPETRSPRLKFVSFETHWEKKIFVTILIQKNNRSLNHVEENYGLIDSIITLMITASHACCCYYCQNNKYVRGQIKGQPYPSFVLKIVVVWHTHVRLLSPTLQYRIDQKIVSSAIIHNYKQRRSFSHCQCKLQVTVLNARTLSVSLPLFRAFKRQSLRVARL